MEKSERLVAFSELGRVNFLCNLLLSGFIVLIITCAVRLLRETHRMSSLLRQVPHPPVELPFGNLGVFIEAYKDGGNGAVFDLLNRIASQYYKDGMFFLWLCWHPLIFFQKPEKVEVLVCNTLSKAPEYRFLHPWLSTGLLTSTGDKWRSRRKLLTPAFHFSILEEALLVFQEQSMVLVEKLRKVQNSVVDIVPYITLCALDIICETAMGTQIRAQTTDTEYHKALKVVSEALFVRIFKPWQWNYNLYALTPSGRRFKKNLAVLHDFTKKVIRQKKEEIVCSKNGSVKTLSEKEDQKSLYKRKRLAFLDLLMHHHVEDHTMTEADIQEEVDTFMFEGHDTTSTGLIWALYNIGLYPDVQRKVQEEISEIFGDDIERAVTSDDLKGMKYLECVLKESQRLYPSVPLIGRDLKEDLVVDGDTFPRGSACAVNIYALHRNPELFPNPEEFDPERFTLENAVKRHPYAYLPFSAGPRNCIGQKFALMEEKTVVCNILRHFTLKSLDRPGFIPLLPELVLRPARKVRIEIYPKETALE